MFVDLFGKSYNWATDTATHKVVQMTSAYRQFRRDKFAFPAVVPPTLLSTAAGCVARAFIRAASFLIRRSTDSALMPAIVNSPMYSPEKPL